MNGFYWLLLEDGRVVVGTIESRTSWAVMTAKGTYECVGEGEILDKRKMRTPRVEQKYPLRRRDLKFEKREEHAKPV